MLVATFILLLLYAIVSSVTNFFTLKKLVQMDRFCDSLAEVTDDYIVFLKETTSKGLLTDHPEVVDFHRRTLALKAALENKRTENFSLRGKNQNGTN